MSQDFRKWFREEMKAMANATRLTDQDNINIESRLGKQRLIHIGGLALIGAAIDYFTKGNGLGMALAAAVGGTIGALEFKYNRPYYRRIAVLRRKRQLLREYVNQREQRSRM